MPELPACCHCASFVEIKGHRVRPAKQAVIILSLISGDMIKRCDKKYLPWLACCATGVRVKRGNGKTETEKRKSEKKGKRRKSGKAEKRVKGGKAEKRKKG